MPIQTNFAVCAEIFHVPLPGGEVAAAALNTAFDREGLRRARLRAAAGKDGIVLTIQEPFPLEALGDNFWAEVGKLVAATGEPWWDFCTSVVDHEAQPTHPHAHALSLYRVTKEGKLRCLLSEDADELR